MSLYENLTMRQLVEHLRVVAKDAILIQDACNLSGIVHSFSTAMALLCEISNRKQKGTDWKNHHPIAVLYASKISSLTGAESGSVFSKAYDRCEKLANADTTTEPYELGWD